MNSFGSFKMWAAVMMTYLIIMGFIGYIAFFPMAFNDPDHTVKKYVDILENYQGGRYHTEGSAGFKETLEDMMRKSQESADDLQELASQSFNIALGALLSFLSATIAMLLQNEATSKKK